MTVLGTGIGAALVPEIETGGVARMTRAVAGVALAPGRMRGSALALGPRTVATSVPAPGHETAAASVAGGRILAPGDVTLTGHVIAMKGEGLALARESMRMRTTGVIVTALALGLLRTGTTGPGHGLHHQGMMIGGSRARGHQRRRWVVSTGGRRMATSLVPDPRVLPVKTETIISSHDVIRTVTVITHVHLYSYVHMHTLHYFAACPY